MKQGEVVIRGGKDAIHMTFVGGQKDAAIQPSRQIAAPTDVYDGRTGRFHKELRDYEQLTYREVYPGVDVLFRGMERSLEFDFLLKPHAAYRSIALDFSGQKDLHV